MMGLAANHEATRSFLVPRSDGHNDQLCDGMATKTLWRLNSARNHCGCYPATEGWGVRQNGPGRLNSTASNVLLESTCRNGKKFTRLRALSCKRHFIMEQTSTSTHHTETVYSYDNLPHCICYSKTTCANRGIYSTKNGVSSCALGPNKCVAVSGGWADKVRSCLIETKKIARDETTAQKQHLVGRRDMTPR